MILLPPQLLITSESSTCDSVRGVICDDAMKNQENNDPCVLQPPFSPLIRNIRVVFFYSFPLPSPYLSETTKYIRVWFY